MKAGTEKELAVDEDGSVQGDNLERKTQFVIISNGDGENPVVTKYIYPEYQGALVISQGAQNPDVRLQLTNAVASLTGLTTDKVTVVKMK